MRKSLYIVLALLMVVAYSDVKAGNPDRQGEAGAFELLLNPWSRSSGLHTLGTANIMGVESMRLNVAGLSFINNTEIVASRSNYLSGSDVYLNAVGLGQRIGKSGVLGLSLMAVDFGDIPITTTNQPEGTGGTFSPIFTNIGLSYAHLFENKISVGLTVRSISESSSSVKASGVALDAGIQYKNENVRLGISLRNIGTPLRFEGEGLSTPLVAPNGSTIMTVDQRAARYELPTVLNIGASYDMPIDEVNKITIVANFASNSFSRDEIGAGVEYSFKDMLMLRAAYKYELGLGASPEIEGSIYTGIAAGASLQVPLSKDEDKKNNKFGIDYSYRTSNPYLGSHNLGVRLSF